MMPLVVSLGILFGILVLAYLAALKRTSGWERHPEGSLLGLVALFGAGSFLLFAVFADRALGLRDPAVSDDVNPYLTAFFASAAGVVIGFYFGERGTPWWPGIWPLARRAWRLLRSLRSRESGSTDPLPTEDTQPPEA